MLRFPFAQLRWKTAEQFSNLIFTSSGAEPTSGTRANPVWRAQSFYPAPFITNILIYLLVLFAPSL